VLPLLRHPQSVPPPPPINVKDQVWERHRTTDKIVVVCVTWGSRRTDVMNGPSSQTPTAILVLWFRKWHEFVSEVNTDLWRLKLGSDVTRRRDVVIRANWTRRLWVVSASQCVAARTLCVRKLWELHERKHEDNYILLIVVWYSVRVVYIVRCWQVLAGVTFVLLIA
jgi:hypothetical protein